jgi:hypothetical protein
MMDNKKPNNSIDKKYVHSKIFQTLKVPERIKRMNELQKNMMNLKHSLVLLEQSNNKRKKTHIKHNNKNSIIISPYISRKNEERKIKKFASLENFVPQSNSSNDSMAISNNSRDKNLLYMNRASALRRKNQVLTQKIKNQKKEDSYRNIFYINKNDIFVTEFNLPNINKYNNKNNRNNNGKHNCLRKVYTESNNYYEKTINNYKNNDMGRSSSDKNILPNIKTQKKAIISLPKNKSSKIHKIIYNNSNDSINSNLSISNINKILSEDNVKDTDNNSKDNINANASKNLAKDSPRNNIINRKANTRLKSHIMKSQEMKNILKNVNKINANMKNKRFYYDLEKWYMKAKFKYTDWKYGISDAQKYFIDMKEYGQQEEIELDMRKSFYEKLKKLIDELKEEKEKKEFLEIEKKYGIKINNEEPKIMKDNEYWIDEHATNKMEEMCKIMKVIKERKKKENENRNIIEEIMFKCKKGVNNIKNS